jgi:hypothetical protein
LNGSVEAKSSIQIEDKLENGAFAAALFDPLAPVPAPITQKGTSQKRFDVYRNNVIISLLEALGDAFPSVRAIAGEQNFSRIARDFIALSPPKTAMMQAFGEEFPSFLKNYTPLKKSLFLADLALAERMWLEAYHARDEEPLGPEAFSSIPAKQVPGLIFLSHPATRLAVSRYPVADLFRARECWPVHGLDLASSQTMLITRPFLSVMTATIESDAETAFLSGIIAGKTLGSAIENGMEHDADFQPQNAISLMLWTGMLSGVIFPHNE